MRNLSIYPFIFLGRLLLTIFLIGWIIYQVVMMCVMLMFYYIFASKSEDLSMLKEGGGQFILHMVGLTMRVLKEGLISTIENY